LLFDCIAVAAQTLSGVAAVFAPSAISGFPLTSPWSVAVSSSNTVYFSNFGGADSVDFIGKVAIDNSNPQELTARTNLSPAIPYMLVKHLATNADTVYAAVYGGPSGVSYIYKCPGGTSCTQIVSINDTLGATFIPTAVAYSTSLSRVFFAVADGNLTKSYIASVKDDGSDLQTYVTQSTSGCEYPVGLCVDDSNSLLFWANDIGSNKIVQGALATSASSVGVVMSDAGSHPQNIATDTAAQYIYFTDQTSNPNKIARVRYGTGKANDQLTTIYSSPMTPTGIALSISKQYVYWADTGSSQIMRGQLTDIGSPAPVTKSGTAGSLSFSLAALVASVAALVSM